MKIKLLFTLISILSLNTYSQIKFEKGYFINNNDEKTICLIRNVDWKNNPSKFDYKLSSNLESKSATIKTIKEFGIFNSTKYVRSIVNIDRSSENIHNLSHNSYPEFNKEQLFLKSLINGKAVLYYYEDGNLKRYFFSSDDSIIEQLIFKSYITIDNKIGKNYHFRQQLYTELKCNESLKKKLRHLKYNKKDLIDLFIEYNQRSNSDFKYQKKAKNKDMFNLNIRPGLNSASLSISNGVSDGRDADFDNELSFRFGVELEFILPYNKNKWAILFEPNYQYYKTEKHIKYQNAFVDYKSIELSLGLRHYLFINDNDKIFIDASYIIDIAIDSKVDFDYTAFPLIIENPNNLALGIGYKHSNKYIFEFLFNFSNDILNGYPSWDSSYKNISMIFGYTLF